MPLEVIEGVFAIVELALEVAVGSGEIAGAVSSPRRAAVPLDEAREVKAWACVHILVLAALHDKTITPDEAALIEERVSASFGVDGVRSELARAARVPPIFQRGGVDFDTVRRLALCLEYDEKEALYGHIVALHRLEAPSERDSGPADGPYRAADPPRRLTDPLPMFRAALELFPLDASK